MNRLTLTLIVTVGYLYSGLLLANSSPKPDPKPITGPVPAVAITGTSAASARADASSAANSTNTVTQGQTANGGSATASAYNTGNDVSFQDRRQAPAISAPPVYASGSCAAGWSVGASAPGFGVSGGRAKPDASCDRRELARVLTPLNPALALKLLCSDPLLAGIATSDDCKYSLPQSAEVARTGEASKEASQASTAGAGDLSQYVRRDEFLEAQKRVLEKAVGK